MSATYLWGKEVRHFFQAEQDAADGSSKRHCNASSTCRAKYLASLAYVMVCPGKWRIPDGIHTFIVFILGKVTADDVSDTARYVHKRTFLSEGEARCDRQR